MITVKQINETEFSISWDATSPTESILNNWTADDFIKVIMEYVQDVNNNE
jgi:hypothetical protein